MLDGAPAPIFFFLGTIALLAGVGDLRMIRAGGIQGSRRIARHLWRMCFGLFVASGSFFLGQAKFIPKPVRIPLLLNVAALAPLVALIYWMWRVRLRNNLRGIVRNNAVRPEV
jgi:ATP adenylyltransferase/5',5'''-P-1,P-4-tetraphosphate phosphorylase II